MIKIWVCIAIILLQHEARIGQSLPGYLVISPRQPLDNFLELQPKMNSEEQYRQEDRYTQYEMGFELVLIALITKNCSRLVQALAP